ncbi:MAG: hypothetical protein V1754_07500, partial [Pseudomonadota bacterium]
TNQHLDLHALVEKTAGRCLAHPTIWHGLFAAKAAVMVSGNAMAHVYLRGPERWGDELFLDEPYPQMERLVQALLGEDAIDQVVGRSKQGGVLILSQKGKALVRQVINGVEYSPESSDPFGYPPKVSGIHKDRELLKLTFDSEYPDAPRQLLQIFESPRCGDLVVTAKPGFDLRARFEKPKHVGSHGSLHRLHMAVPFLTNHALVDDPKRTVDLYPTVLSALGLPWTNEVDGISLWGITKSSLVVLLA